MTNDRDARHDQPCGTPAEAAANIPSSPEEDEVDLLDLLLVFVRHWRLIAGVTFLFAVGGLAYALLATPIYRAEARLVPPTGGGSSGAMAMLAQLGGAADFAAGALGVKTPADLLVGLVKSRTVVDRIIAEFSLLEQYQQEKMTTCRTAVLGLLSVTADMKSGIITLAYEDKSPDQAAAIANAFVRGLQDLLKGLAVTQASQQRLFLEEQLKKAQLDLLQAENNLQAYQQTTGILNVDAQMAALLQNVAQLKALIAAKEVELRSARTFATARNPEIKKLTAELGELRKQLENVERQAKVKEQTGKISEANMTVANVPEAGMEYLRRLRDLKFNETLFEMLLKQYEAARLSEASDPLVVQVVDEAVPPDHKAKPKRAVIAIISTLLGGFVGVCWAFLRQALENMRRDPARREKLVALGWAKSLEKR